MTKYFLAFFISISGFCNAQIHDLVKYYNGELNLSEDQVLCLSDSIIEANSDDYLSSLAYYQKSVIQQREDANFLAFESLDLSLAYLLNADTVDDFLYCAILRNQGYILKQHWLIDGAIDKYSQAVNPAYAYSIERGLSVKYNLARALAYKEPEEAIQLLLEIIDEAKKERLNDRAAKAYNELGLMLVRSDQYKDAKGFFDKALEYASGKEATAFTYQNISHMHYESENYEEQKHWLLKSLSLGEHRNRFISLIDLGENHIISGDHVRARKYLQEAELLYNDRPLKPDYVKVFRWLSDVSVDFKEELRYERKRGDELEKIVIIQQKLEAKLKQQAMLQLYKRLEEQKHSKKAINFYQVIAISGGVLVLAILFTWRIWWYRLKKRLGKKILEVVGKWTDEPS